MSKFVKEKPLLPLLRNFINQIKKGKHLQKNGNRIKRNSINNYLNLEKLLTRFSDKHNFYLRLRMRPNASKSNFELEKKYWSNFYHSFTTYLFDELRHHDNHVGRQMKLMRCFFNYLINEKGYEIGHFHKKFYVKSEDVEIIALTPERLNYLVYNKEIERKLTPRQAEIKDIFVFGCMVALRFSDLMSLKKSNIEVINERVYIKVQSKKTQTFTMVKLPEFATTILNRYSKKYVNNILPRCSIFNFNGIIKKIIEIYGFVEPIDRLRQRSRISQPIYKDETKKIRYRFCDLVSSHTMRRSGITIMLSLGMNEHMVRQISGHSPNSKEFFRYVAYAQNYIDCEIDSVHDKLESKKLILNPKNNNKTDYFANFGNTKNQ